MITQNAIEQFLYREARYLDDREFEKWLGCYADDVGVVPRILRTGIGQLAVLHTGLIQPPGLQQRAG